MDVGGIDVELERVRERTREAAGTGLLLAAEHILGVSRTRVPHEDGVLERSSGVRVDTENLEAVIAYDTPYAVAQHEELDFVHDNGRQAKFLESAVTGERDVVRRILATHLRAALKK